MEKIITKIKMLAKQHLTMRNVILFALLLIAFTLLLWGLAIFFTSAYSFILQHLEVLIVGGVGSVWFFAWLWDKRPKIEVITEELKEHQLDEMWRTLKASLYPVILRVYSAFGLKTPSLGVKFNQKHAYIVKGTEVLFSYVLTKSTANADIDIEALAEVIEMSLDKDFSLGIEMANKAKDTLIKSPVRIYNITQDPLTVELWLAVGNNQDSLQILEANLQDIDF